jgi:hypothetical protein
MQRRTSPLDLGQMPKTKLIAHRGNTIGSEARENHPDFIRKAYNAGFDVEVDLWRIENKWILGHDAPQYEVDIQWVIDSSTYCYYHCKNHEALSWLGENLSRINFFYHNTDLYTLTSKREIWAYPTATPLVNAIVACPEMHQTKELVLQELMQGKWAGVCSDYVEFYKRYLYK